MKKLNKLHLNKETVRSLSVGTLTHAVGGLSGNNCSYGLTGCTACPPPRPSLRFSDCQACVTDICTFE
ncbi:MAG TPA: class I lanthipeptide [Kofleriaceae bacterium]|nr:class I lanthipeptide [Kofleriaceae bacterium]